MNTALAQTCSTPSQPVLKKVNMDLEHRKQRDELFALLGWSKLPEPLKDEIEMDVHGFVAELQGQYSSCDPYVRNRRKRVLYWVGCYTEGVCSLETAVSALNGSWL